MTVRDLAACLVSLSEDSEGRISLERVNAVLEFIETEIPEVNITPSSEELLISII